MRKITLRRSEGFVTGIKDGSADKEYKMVDNAILTEREADKVTTGITYDEQEARISCNRHECNAFVREVVDGKTIFYKILAKAYETDVPLPEDETELITVDIDKPPAIPTNKEGFYRLKEANTVGGGTTADTCKIPLFLIIIFIVLVIVLIMFPSNSSEGAKAPTWEIDLSPFQTS